MSRDFPIRYDGSGKWDKRTPYTGNKNPSAEEYAREGYATIIKADPSDPYRAEDRPTLGDDADYDPKLVR